MKEINAKSAKKFCLRFFLHECDSAFFTKEMNHVELTIPRIGEAVWLPPKYDDPNDPFNDSHKYRVTDVEYPSVSDDVETQLIDIMVKDATAQEVVDEHCS